jgi:hypothetical protein
MYVNIYFKGCKEMKLLSEGIGDEVKGVEARLGDT